MSSLIYVKHEFEITLYSPFTLSEQKVCRNITLNTQIWVHNSVQDLTIVVQISVQKRQFYWCVLHKN